MRSLRRASHSSAPPPARPPETAQPLPLPGERQRGGTLTPQQVAFFETFGFLRLPGLFADDVDGLTEGFEEIFEQNESFELDGAVHRGKRRLVILPFLERSRTLSDVPEDPRVLGVVTSLMGTGFAYVKSDGNRYDCDTSWHVDSYSAPLDQSHLKLCFYLDPLTAGSGALRVLPGTNDHHSPYALGLYRDVMDPEAIADRFGVEGDELPSYTVESTPGDVIALNFRTMHASFHGRPGRRLFTLNFRGVEAPS